MILCTCVCVKKLESNGRNVNDDNKDNHTDKDDVLDNDDDLNVNKNNENKSKY